MLLEIIADNIGKSAFLEAYVFKPRMGPTYVKVRLKAHIVQAMGYGTNNVCDIFLDSDKISITPGVDITFTHWCEPVTVPLVAYNEDVILRYLNRIYSAMIERVSRYERHPKNYR